jgi:hypothetical protein
MIRYNDRRFEKEGEESMNKRIAPKKQGPSGEEDE